ncbi:MAG TPA: prepilin-type N-terminal cleavage/methylation domain-containing protein [Gemmatimonadaceae bacterium]|nr:prepilin-type N-terminal cleavage/methylation domain-containing protein [Gemmatimonadaceae bacterium]
MLRRRGVSLVEMLVTLLALSIVSSVALGLLLRQQRFYAKAAEAAAARTALREGIDLVATFLRTLSPSAGDLYAIDPAGMEFRAVTGTAVICGIDSTRTHITVPPVDAPLPIPLTSWVAEPLAGDTVLLYDPGVSQSMEDDAWRPNALAADPTTGPCATTGPFAGITRGRVLRLSSPSPITMGVGELLRVTRRTRLGLYRAGDGLWYLGFSDCLSSRALPCSSPQPVSGPFDRSQPAFAFRDATGLPTTTPAAVRQFGITLRVLSAGGGYLDSLSTLVAARN